VVKKSVPFGCGSAALCNPWLTPLPFFAHWRDSCISWERILDVHVLHRHRLLTDDDTNVKVIFLQKQR
jgi:hypothetical protein